MATQNKISYAALASQISEYVQAHLADDIVIDDLAAHCGVSKYHLNRLFYAITGFQLGEFIRRRRLQAAYALLAGGNTTVIDASMAVGYASHAAFSRAFLNAFDCKPSEVARGSTHQWRTPDTIKKTRSIDETLTPEIVELPTQYFRGLLGTGFQDSSFTNLGTALFDQLHGVLATAGLGHLLAQPIGVSLDSPWQGDQAESRFFMGVSGESVPASLPLTEFSWRKGTWARFDHVGSYQRMWQTISRIYANWVVPEQIKLLDETIIQVYLNNPSNAAESELRTALYFPVNLHCENK